MKPPHCTESVPENRPTVHLSKFVEKSLMNPNFFFSLLFLFHIFFSSEVKKGNKAKNVEGKSATEAKENKYPSIKT